jgi:hypothetical protein
MSAQIRVSGSPAAVTRADAKDSPVTLSGLMTDNGRGTCSGGTENDGLSVTLRLRCLRRLLVPGLVTLALVATGCTGNGAGGGTGSSPTFVSGSVRNLTSIEMLRSVFNKDAGSTRLVLLISPT